MLEDLSEIKALISLTSDPRWKILTDMLSEQLNEIDRIIHDPGTPFDRTMFHRGGYLVMDDMIHLRERLFEKAKQLHEELQREEEE